MARKKDKKKKKEEEESTGWDEEDADEALEAEDLKKGELDEGRVDLYDADTSTAGIETYDEDTGQKEGEIILKDGNTEGLLALVKIIEEVNVEQDHDGLISSINFVGNLNVENPSTIDRLWDIDITLANIESTSLESAEIDIRELGTTEDTNVDSREFQISGDPKNQLLIKEYINTLPNADDILNIMDIEKDLLTLKEAKAEEGEEELDGEEEEEEDLDEDEEEEYDEDYDGGAEAAEQSLESFAISIDKENVVTFAIALRSLFQKPISNVKIVKDVPDVFSNIMIRDTTVGMAEQEGGQIVWNIDELEPETTALLKFSADIFTSSIDPVNTGTIEVTYEAQSSFAGGLEIDRFDAYTRNRFYIDILEQDEAPGVWDCKLVFENTSEFIVQLFNADVYTPEDETNKLIDIDPNDVPQLPAGAEWHSVPWNYESEDYPSFRKRLEFRVVPDFQTIVNGTTAMGEAELQIASLTGDVIFRLKEITADTERDAPVEGEEETRLVRVPTYKETDVYASLRILNNGSAPLNEVKVVHQFFNEEFAPTTAEEVKLILNDAEVELAAEAITIADNILTIELKDLKDTDAGLFEPDEELEFQYPIHCMNPPRDARFESEVMYYGNTFPLSQELEYAPSVPVIEAVHLRRKFRIGKEVMPVGELGEYEIILSIENVGDMPLENLTLMDKVPENFEYGEYSVEPALTDEIEQDVLQWNIEQLEDGEKLEISYKITGKGEYSPSDAQLAL